MLLFYYYEIAKEFLPSKQAYSNNKILTEPLNDRVYIISTLNFTNNTVQRFIIHWQLVELKYLKKYKRRFFLQIATKIPFSKK